MAEPKLPVCCTRKKNAIAMEAGDVAAAVRKWVKNPSSERLQQAVTEAKDSKARAIEAFEVHINDESLEHA